MRRLLRMVALLGVVVCIVEFICRALGFGSPPLAMVDNDVEYYLKPSASYRRFGNEITTNRFGMRSVDWGDGPPDRVRHIAIFGDSVVYGTNQIDQAQTIATVLQELLTRRFGKELLVSAIAASSWGPANELAFYRKFGPFPGVCAIVVLSSHDIDDYPTFNVRDIPYRLSAPYGAAHDAALSIRARVVRKDAGARIMRPSEDRTHLSVQALRDLLALLARDFDGVMVVFHPERGELNDVEGVAEKEYRQVASESNAEFHSIRQKYMQATSEGEPIYLDGKIHLNSSGAALMAQSLFEWLARDSEAEPSMSDCSRVGETLKAAG